MNHYRFLLRLSYWVAAIADFIIAVLVLIPQRMGVTEFVYPMGLMSAVAFSWGVMLVFADRRPLERRWILAPTILVVFLLGTAVAYAGISGLIPAEQFVAAGLREVNPGQPGGGRYAWWVADESTKARILADPFDPRYCDLLMGRPISEDIDLS